MSIRTIMVALLALVCGVSAAVAVMQLRGDKPHEEVATQMVVVAKVPIDRNTKLQPELLELRPYPEQYILPGSVSTMDEVVGVRATYGFLSGEPILLDKIGGENPSGDIPEGMRVVSIQARRAPESGAGWVHPGDFVDVFLTFNDDRVDAGATRTVNLFQDTEVFAVGASRGNANDDRLQDTATVTLLVTPDQAQTIALTENHGSYTLALRSPDDKELRDYSVGGFEDLPFMQALLQREREKEAQARRSEQWNLAAEALANAAPPLEGVESEAATEEQKVYVPPRYAWILRGSAYSRQMIQPGHYETVPPSPAAPLLSSDRP